MTNIEKLCHSLDINYPWLSSLSFSISRKEITFYSVNGVGALDTLRKTQNDKYLSILIAKNIKQSDLLKLELDIAEYLLDMPEIINNHFFIKRDKENKIQYKQTTILEFMGTLYHEAVDIL
jgi:hypothetical protein